MKLLITTFITMCLIAKPLINNAQTEKNGTVGGLVTNQQKPIEAANIALLKAKDSAIVKMAVSTKGGNFEFSGIANGQYFVSVQAIGYAKYYSINLEIAEGKKNVQLNSIILQLATNELTNVTVTSKKPLIEQKLDRTIINVEASATNVGSNALEVLEKSPGVTLDKDGNISLKGKEGVQIFLDGKPAFVSGADLVNLLRSMQASQLDQIEIMTNPPAKYDAAGNAGIINIKTKKTKAYGLNGSATVGAGYGVNARTNQSVNVNYRKNKVNIFGNASYYNTKSFQDLTIDRKFLDNSTNKNIVSLFKQTNNLLKHNQGFSAKGGIDYFINKKTTIGAVVSGTNNTNNFTSDAAIQIANPQNILQMQTLGFTKQDTRFKNFTSNINFKHTLDTTGKEITADIDYNKYDILNNINLTNRYLNGAGNPMSKNDSIKGLLPQKIDIFTAKIDYVMPLKKGARFEAGLKASFVKTDANAIYDSIKNGGFIRDVNRSNHFIYNENVNAAYVSFSKPLSKKWSMQLGLRAEQMITKGNQITTGQVIKRDSLQLFPTAYFQFTPSEKNSFVLNYGRRIRRPDYESLNPFIEFIDKYTIEQGNPYLTPQFSHNIELTHTYKGFLTTTVNYTQTNDIITQVLEQNSLKNETAVRQANVAKQRQLGISVNAFNQYTSWWSGNIYANVFYNKYDGIVNNEYAVFEATTAVFNVSQNFKLKKGTAIEVGGFYRTNAIEGVFAINGFGVLNLGISQPIMKGKGTVRFGVRDVLWSQKIKGSSRYGSIDAAFTQQQESRVASLSFTYRFNKGSLKAQQRRRSNASEDEQNRVNGSK